jgi:thiamine kinase-like enzyme
MVIALDSHNFLPYLHQHHLLPAAVADVTTQIMSARNFNLLVRAEGQPSLLLKQETISSHGQQSGKLLQEWRLQQLTQQIPELVNLQARLPQVLHCDEANGIVVNRFLEDYWDLSDYYDRELCYPPALATTLGQLMGQFHNLTFDRPAIAQAVLAQVGPAKLRAKQFLRQMDNLNSKIFGVIPQDCLRFYKLYQQYPSLEDAVQQLATTNSPCTLVHNDMKLNNILVHRQWETSSEPPLRSIDWERAGWGDPASDLGMMLGSYLNLWLDSLVVGAELSITESLQLATVPLAALQPSLLAMVAAYLEVFPAILLARPAFVLQVMQYAGLALIGRIEARIAYSRHFGNGGVVMLQVAKQLLCTPASFVTTIFGPDGARLPLPQP